MTAQDLVWEMPKGLIKWHNLKKGGRAVYITAGQPADEALKEALAECGVFVDCFTPAELTDMDFPAKYDYAVIMSAIERTLSVEKSQELLIRVKGLMKADGVLFLGMDNRLGIRYFCGDRDAYTGRNFDSIENYVHARGTDYDILAGHSFAKAEIIKMIEAAGFSYHRFYSVYPVLHRPQILFAEDYVPAEPLEIRIFPQYNSPDTVFLEEERLYDAMIQNGLFHIMANGFWIECPLDGILSNASQITVSADRGRENASYTIIRRDGRVEKKAIYPEGFTRIARLPDNHQYLSEHGVHMVDVRLEQESLVMPCIRAVSAVVYLRDLVLNNKKLFYERLDELWKLILSSSEHVPYTEINWEQFDPYWDKRKSDDPAKDRWKRLACGTRKEQDSIGVILKRGYIDLVPLNCFFADEKFLFYDQEAYVENLPAKVILLRTIDLIYTENLCLYEALPMEEVKERYGLIECQDLFYAFVGKFLNELRNDGLLRFYHKQVRRDIGVLNANRQRMNYSADNYEKIFRDIFKGAENRQLYLFGSGSFARQFISQFGAEYKIAGIIDNNPAKQGMQFEGISIYSPEYLRDLEQATFKVIICIKNYLAVMRQLHDMGITDFSIYDSSLTYPRKQAAAAVCAEEKAIPKKYHVGYIAGVFDLFHIGHLNLFRRAKEQCDYLIAGVVTDEGVMRDKRTMPFVPFEERIEIVRSCRYVDEAVAIPPDRSNTDEAYRRYQFDVQFSGSDYEHDEAWLAKRDFLRSHGSDLVFFPYTQSTSSTKIKDLINKKLV